MPLVIKNNKLLRLGVAIASSTKCCCNLAECGGCNNVYEPWPSTGPVGPGPIHDGLLNGTIHDGDNILTLPRDMWPSLPRDIILSAVIIWHGYPGTPPGTLGELFGLRNIYGFITRTCYTPVFMTLAGCTYTPCAPDVMIGDHVMYLGEEYVVTSISTGGTVIQKVSDGTTTTICT